MPYFLFGEINAGVNQNTIDKHKKIPKIWRIYEISVDLNGVRYGPDGQAGRREKWVHEATREARKTARVAFGWLSHTPPRELSSQAQVSGCAQRHSRAGRGFE